MFCIIEEKVPNILFILLRGLGLMCIYGCDVWNKPPRCAWYHSVSKALTSQTI